MLKEKNIKQAIGIIASNPNIDPIIASRLLQTIKIDRTMKEYTQKQLLFNELINYNNIINNLKIFKLNIREIDIKRLLGYIPNNIYLYIANDKIEIINHLKENYPQILDRYGIENLKMKIEEMSLPIVNLYLNSIYFDQLMDYKKLIMILDTFNNLLDYLNLWKVKMTDPITKNIDNFYILCDNYDEIITYLINKYKLSKEEIINKTFSFKQNEPEIIISSFIENNIQLFTNVFK